MQQPEVHLHPKAQAALGDAVYSLAAGHKKAFFIETHSEYLIDRFRINLRERRKNVPSQVLFFQRKRGENFVCGLVLESNGSYPQKQPKEFGEFFLTEQLRLLDI